MSTPSPNAEIRTYEAKASKPSLLRFITRIGSSNSMDADSPVSPRGQFRRMGDISEATLTPSPSNKKRPEVLTFSPQKSKMFPPTPKKIELLSPTLRLATLTSSIRLGGSVRASLTYDEAELEAALLSNPEAKERLSNAFVTEIGSDLCTKLEYFTAAAETLREQDRKEKHRKHKMLVKLFFQSTMVEMRGIPNDLVNDMLAMKVEAIIRVQKLVADDLFKHPLVTDLMTSREVKEE
ncbi:hypothetical protein BASA81_015751 [Batrachochytrium salamandrivorans]|nr:hypothetical protein BASA81_015751 [Batrachochytrium salamandrivorans]